MTKFIYPGSFNPFTIGHLDIVKQALPLCDELVIGFAFNPNKSTDNIIENYNNVVNIFKDNPKVSIRLVEGLLADYCKINQIDYIIRGLRNTKDFEEEKTLAYINQELRDIPTLFFIAKKEHDFISSSFVRELQKYNYSTQQYLPK